MYPLNPDDMPSRSELAADAWADRVADVRRRLEQAAQFFTASEFAALKEALAEHALGAEDVADPDDPGSLEAARVMASLGEAVEDLHPEGVGTRLDERPRTDVPVTANDFAPVSCEDVCAARCQGVCGADHLADEDIPF